MANTLLNQIFYNINKFDVDPKLCEKYMLLIDYVNNVTPIEKAPVSIVQEVEKPIIKKEPKFFSPKKDDKLFWCIYTLSIGESEYYMIGNKYKNAEIEEKKQVMEYISVNRNTIKNIANNNGIKISNVKMQMIQSDLLTDKKTTWFIFWIMCVFYKVNVLLVQDTIYMKFNVDNEYKTYLFLRDDHFHVSFDNTELNTSQINKLVENKLEIDPFNDKILKGVSTYKTTELENMAQVLNVVPEPEKPKKSDYYETVISKLVSMKIQN